MNIDELAILLGTEVEVGWSTSCKDFYASISNLEIVEGCVLTSLTGRGKTPAQAKRNYARRIAGKTITVDGRKSDRRTFQVPDTLK